MTLRTISVAVLILLAGCSTTDYDPYVAATENQLATRSFQTRYFENAEYKQLLQSVVSTLQDYHFRIHELDTQLGVLTAYQHTEFDSRTGLGGRTEVCIFIKPRGEQGYLVRVNMVTGTEVENEPELYQQFFAALQRKLHYRSNT